MKLAITDAESFGDLNPLEVKAYLVDTGWLEARVLEHRGSYWRHPAHAEVEIPLPFDRKLGDFSDRMRDAVERLIGVAVSEALLAGRVGATVLNVDVSRGLFCGAVDANQA